MPFNVGDVVTFKSKEDHNHVIRTNSIRRKILFPTENCHMIISFVEDPEDNLGIPIVKIQGCNEGFYANRFVLVSEDNKTTMKYYKVISKIKQMDIKRKEMGYAF